MSIRHTAFADTVTAAQHRYMHRLWRDYGVTTRADRLRMTGIMLNRDITSSRELTRQEATRLIDLLTTTGPEDLF